MTKPPSSFHNCREVNSFVLKTFDHNLPDRVSEPLFKSELSVRLRIHRRMAPSPILPPSAGEAPILSDFFLFINLLM